MSGVVVDTSAVLAVLLSEPAAEPLLARLDASELSLMSMASLVEVGIVAEARLGPAGYSLADRFVRDGGIELVPLDRSHADAAVEGWRRFGKGQHPASLNLGDCFTYGLAVSVGLPVLCVGGDFLQTDVEVVDLTAV